MVKSNEDLFRKMTNKDRLLMLDIVEVICSPGEQEMKRLRTIVESINEKEKSLNETT